MAQHFGGTVFSYGQEASTPARPPVDSDGTVHLPAQAVPDTALMSKEWNDSRTYYINMIGKPPKHELEPGRIQIFEPFIAKAKTMFPQNRKDATMAGVHVFDYTPKGGVPANKKNLVLIHLHGGGFRNGWLDCGELEAMPVALQSKIRTISIDYRQGEENPFPQQATMSPRLLHCMMTAAEGVGRCSFWNQDNAWAASTPPAEQP